MFLAAAPYFIGRFQSNEWVSSNFLSSILSVSTLTNLSSVLVLAKMQENASYPRRIQLSLMLNISVFILLTLSTVLFRGVSAVVYFCFVLVLVFCASLGTGLIQNGIFAYVSGFGQERYIQAIMAGQGVAGVLPAIAQILSVLSSGFSKAVANADGVQYQSAKSAFAFFSTAVCVSGVAFLAFTYLDRRHSLRIIKAAASAATNEEEAELASSKKPIPLLVLFGRLRLTALAVFMCFGVTMIYPVFATRIDSVRDNAMSDPLFRPAVFIPLANLIWNIGDLFGRVIPVVPQLNISAHPLTLFVMSVARLGFIPLYLLCNIRGRGTVIHSDAFYLIVVQFLFGVSNGYIGASCMMGAVEWVVPEEREAAGAFMSLMLVAGLTAGSLLSFLIKV